MEGGGLPQYQACKHLLLIIVGLRHICAKTGGRPPSTITFWSNSVPAMPSFPESRLAPQIETIDLTVTASTSSPSTPIPGHPPQLVDLTILDTSSGSTRDHMHAVVALLRPRSIDLTQDNSEVHRKCKATESTSSLRRKVQSALLQHRSIQAEQAYDSIDTTSAEDPLEPVEKPSISSIPLAWNPHHRSKTSVTLHQHALNSRKGPPKPFPFMEFPPEIRNCVYKMLLTTPKSPIEFPEPTGRNRALRTANWEKCTTWRMRRRHKTIFLEILEVSKQLHTEASGILYGCNVFKYRSDYGTYTH